MAELDANQFESRMRALESKLDAIQQILQNTPTAENMKKVVTEVMAESMKELATKKDVVAKGDEINGYTQQLMQQFLPEYLDKKFNSLKIVSEPTR